MMVVAAFESMEHVVPSVLAVEAKGWFRVTIQSADPPAVMFGACKNIQYKNAHDTVRKPLQNSKAR